jgi:putative ABC transport system ATP-binding protein
MIEFEDVSLKFLDKTIFEHVSFHVLAKDKIIISGKSGIGKSSLLHLLLGFKKQTSGLIKFENEAISPLLLPLIRQKIAYIPQGIFIGRGKVEDNIKEIFHLKANRPITYHADKLSELLDFLELPNEILPKKLELLSGGEKQRIAIAIALLLQRNIFLLDEITSALDKHLKQKIIQFFLQKQDATVLFISHDIIGNVPENTSLYDLEKNKWIR